MLCIQWVYSQQHVSQFQLHAASARGLETHWRHVEKQRRSDDKCAEPLAERWRKSQKMFAEGKEWDTEGFRRPYSEQPDALHETLQPPGGASFSNQPLRAHREAALLAHPMGEPPRAASFTPARHTAMVEGRPVQVLFCLRV